MNGQALLFLIVTWSSIIALTLYCFKKMLTAPPPETHESEVAPTP